MRLHSPVGTVTWWVLATACQCDSSRSSPSMGSGLSLMSSSWSSSSPSRSSREISAMISVGGRSPCQYFLWEADRCETRNNWTRRGYSKDLLSRGTTGCWSDQMQICSFITDVLSGNNSSEGGTALSFYLSPARGSLPCSFLTFIFIFSYVFTFLPEYCNSVFKLLLMFILLVFILTDCRTRVVRLNKQKIGPQKQYKLWSWRTVWQRTDADCRKCRKPIIKAFSLRPAWIPGLHFSCAAPWEKVGHQVHARNIRYR